MRTKFAAVILMLYASACFGQTVSDFEMKYGKPVSAYAVSESIWMTPEYTVDGKICQMRLYPKRIAHDTNYLSKRLPFEELKTVINHLHARSEKRIFRHYCHWRGRCLDNVPI